MQKVRAFSIKEAREREAFEGDARESGSAGEVCL